MPFIEGTTLVPGARAILDAAEFARLVRKHRRLGVHIRDYDGHGYAYTYVSAKEALSMIEHGQLEALEWTADAEGVDVTGCKAPENIALRRAVVRLRAKREILSERVTRYTGRTDCADPLAWAVKDLARTEKDLASAETRLAALRAQPLAA